MACNGLGFRLGLTYIQRMLLRLRKKPPANMPDINSGTPWSEMDLADLEELLGSGTSIESVASYLRREPEEVEIEVKLRGLIQSRMLRVPLRPSGFMPG